MTKDIGEQFYAKASREYTLPRNDGSKDGFMETQKHQPDRSETRETFPRTETIRSHSSRAGKPSNLSRVSNEIISDSVEL